MTQWAAKVDPAHPLPEYPRPQLVRKDWLNLNGIWEYQPGAAADALPTGKLKSEILVPYPVESALSGVMEHHQRLWYRRTFEVPADWKGRNVILHFGAVDFESEVFVNGKSVGVHRGGYDPFSYDITAVSQGFRRPGADCPCVRSRPITRASRAASRRSSRTMSITPARPASGRRCGSSRSRRMAVKSLKIVPDVDNGRVRVTVQTYRSMDDETGDVAGEGRRVRRIDGVRRAKHRTGSGGSESQNFGRRTSRFFMTSRSRFQRGKG